MLDPSSTEFLADIGTAMATAEQPDMALEQTLETIRQALGAEAASIFLYDPGEQVLECKASLGPNPATGMRVPRGAGIVGQVAEQRRGVLVENVATHPSFYRAIDEQTGFVTRSVVCAPLGVRDKVLGAVTLLNKRVGGPFTAGDLALLVGYCALAALSINNARLSILALERERLQRELEIAREIQRSMLPAVGQARIRGANLPARVVSGDFYGHLVAGNDEAWFCLGDVSGKGIDAALWMVRALTLFSCLAPSHRSPARLLEALNAGLRQVALRGMFITMVVGRVDAAGNRGQVANAGHLPVLVLQGGRIDELPASGPPIGILDGMLYEDVNVGPGPATLCMVSDGVVEAIAGRAFTDLDALKQRIGDMLVAGSFSADALIAGLSPRGAGLDDDATVLTVELLAEKEADLNPPLFTLRFPATSDRLKPMREALAPVLQEQGVDAQQLQSLVLAINEACMNIVQHCAPENPGMQITLQLRREGSTLVFDLLDDAAPIDVRSVQPRDLADVRPGGLGVHFMREIMDDVAFLQPPPGFGNLLRMRKHLHAVAPG